MSQRSNPRPPGGRGQPARRGQPIRHERPARGDRPSSRALRTQRQAGTSRRGLDPRLIAAGVAGLVLIVTAFVLAGGLGGGAAIPTPGPVGSQVAGSCPTSQPPALGASDTRTVTIVTPKGSIVIKVHGAWSPIAAGNFVALAACGFYDGVVFHRTAALQDGTPFVIQGGDPSGNGTGGPGYTIVDEPVTQTYRRGTVAMARSSAPNSQGSQFFIVLDDKDGSVLASANTYAIFGEVTSGMDVADAIFQASGGQELPSNPVPMTTVTVTSP